MRNRFCMLMQKNYVLNSICNFYLQFECLITKATGSQDHDERAKIVHLNHPNLPKDMSYNKSSSSSKHTALRVFVSSNCKDLLSYFLEKQPGLDDRIHFYKQITDAVKHLHDNKLALCYLSPMHIMVIDGDKQVGGLFTVWVTQRVYN